MKTERYPHLPPLNTLLVFEAAARNESFVKAADELYLTASAVAHQVKKLEASLGMALFIRHARGVNLSLQGREYYRHIQQHLNEINRHSEQTKDYSLRPLKISTQHAIAQLWLQPRLGEYQDQYNDREMEIIAQSRIGSSPTDVDIAISYFPEPPSGKSWHLLWEESLIPVCQPEYKQFKPVLYQDAHWSDDWHAWQQQSSLTNSNLPEFSFSSIRSASLYVLVLQSVMDKRGIMVARQTLLQDYLQSGKLVTWPESDTPAVTYGAYYMYQSPASLNNPFANEFREWLVQKIGRNEEYPQRFTLLSQQTGHRN